ncbi:hypothetical protein RJ641_032916 [Dillenia turbinata]|uniref:Uncharacterized protein n=1 Tax=Dillenia turbinata TaxID=194707 RepID=A0AAN8VTN4_9MAGN
MTFFNGLGIALTIVFGCVLLALIAQLFYLLWWKKRVSNKGIEVNSLKYAIGVFYFLCWKRPITHDGSENTEELTASVRNSDANCHELVDPEIGNTKDVVLRAFGDEGVETELMRLHNLSGPPKFLFTIKEETKEDLESDDGKSRGGSRKGSRTRSLSDLLVAVETPFLSPLSSPRVNPSVFNPLFESSIESELNRLRSSPPPTLKFLRDAEEKLYKRLIAEAEKRAQKNCGSLQDCGVKACEDQKDGSFLAIVVGNGHIKEKGNQQSLPQYYSSSKQVLPLASSPSTFTQPDKKSNLH